MKAIVDKAIDAFEKEGKSAKYLLLDYASHYELASEVIPPEDVIEEELAILEFGLYRGIQVAVCYDRNFFGFDLV